MRFTPVRNFSDAYIFQGYYSSWLFISREFKVVKTVVIQNEPAALPTLNPENLKVNVKVDELMNLFNISSSKNKHSPCPRSARNIYEDNLGEENITYVKILPSTLLPKPSLSVRIEEGVHQIIAVILRDLKRLRFDAVI